MPKFSRPLVYATLAALAGCGGGSSSSNSTFTLLPSSGTASDVLGVAPAGALVVGQIGLAGSQTGVEWNGSADPQAAIPAVSGDVVTLDGVTDAGAVFGSETSDGGTTNVPVTGTSISAALTPLPLPSGVASATVADTSDDGSVVLGRSSAGLFVVSGGTATSLSNSVPTGRGDLISGDGTVVFQANALGVVKRVLSTGVTTTVIPPTANPTVAGVGQTGTVITGALFVSGTSNTHTYRLVNSTFTDLGTLNSDVSSYPTGMDHSGTTIVGVSTSASGDAHPFIWQTSSAKMVALTRFSNFGGLTNVTPTGISSDGLTIIGYGTENAGTGSAQVRAWKLKI